MIVTPTVGRLDQAEGPAFAPALPDGTQQSRTRG